MMTISVPKLVLIIIVILAVWYVSRCHQSRRRRAGASAPARDRSRRRGRDAIEDLVPCRTCGAYVSPGARDCGRPACPQAR